MAIEKINFSYPKGTLQSVYDTETVTALELASKTARKVDECIEVVNGVGQTAVESRAIVDNMKTEQESLVQNLTEVVVPEATMDYFDQKVTDGTISGIINQGLLGQINSDITALQNDDTTKATEIAGLDGRLDTAETNITNLQTTTATHTTEISNLATTHTNDVNALDGRLDTAETNITGLQNTNSQQTTDIAGLDTRIDTLESTVGNNITTLETTTAQHTTDITGLDTRLDTAETNITTNATNITTINNSRNTGIVNVEDYGANVNNTASQNDTAFANAIASIPNGGVLYIPARSTSYKLSKKLIVNKSITIKGGKSSDDQDGGTRSTILEWQTVFDGSQNRAIELQVSGVTIEDIYLLGFYSSTLTTGIYASAKLDININNVWIFKFSHGVYFNDCLMSTFKRVTVRDCQYGFRFESTTTGGTSITCINCWVQTFSQSGFRLISHSYCTFINCGADGLDGLEGFTAYQMYSCSNINFYGCGSEKVKNSHYYFETCNNIVVSGCFGYKGNIITTYPASFGYMYLNCDNINFIGCKDYTPQGTGASICKTTGSTPPTMINCDFPKGYNHEAWFVRTISKGSICIGLASLTENAICLQSSDVGNVIKKISVNNANTITAITVTP